MLIEGRQTKVIMEINKYLTQISDENKKCILDLYNYLISKKVQAKSGIRFDYKKHYLLVIITDSPELNLRVSLCQNKKNNYKYILEEIGKSPDKNDLLVYIANNIQYCDSCENKKDNDCGQGTEFFGEQRKICSFGRGLLILSKKNNNDKNYYDYDIKMLKQILDLRIKEIDNFMP